MAFLDLVTAADRAIQSHLGGDVITYQPEHEDAVEVIGLFDEQYVRVDSGNGDVEQAGPAVWLSLADLPVDPEEDNPLLTIKGKTYTVHERQADGFGSIRLLLHRADVDVEP